MTLNEIGVDIETQDDKVWCIGTAGAGGRSARCIENMDFGNCTPVVHNGTFDLAYLDPDGTRIPFWHDTIIEGHLLGYRPLALPSLAEVFLGVSLDKTPVKERKTVRFEERGQTVLEMCSLDAWASWALHDLWKDKLDGYEHLLEMERKVTRILISMKQRGLPVSDPKLQTARKYILQQMTQCEQAMARHGIDPLNVQDVAQRFWEGKKAVTTETGKLTTKKEALRENIQGEDEEEWVNAYILWKQCDKFRSTYIDAWMGKDVVRASLNQTGTATWRFSCSDPNLQNVPRSADIPLYNLFEAPEGCVFISADYSQLEMRIMANASGDAVMKGAYISGRDLHTETELRLAQMGIFDKLGVSKDYQRTFSKTINFGIAYGMTAYGLAKRLKISQSAAQVLIDGFYMAYPAMVPWQEEQIAFATRYGYVETFLGRPIYTPCMLADEGQLRHHGEKQAVNGPIQGGAADIVKQAMIRCPQYLVMQVHDDLVYVVPENEAEDYKHYLEENLADYQHDVPYIAEPKIGKTWGDLKDIQDKWVDGDE